MKQTSAQPAAAAPGASRRYVVGTAAAVVAGGGLLLFFGPAGRLRVAPQANTSGRATSGGPAATGVKLPAFVRGAEAAEAYLFAVERPDVLQYIACYCGCGQSEGHTSNLSCFVTAARPDGSYEFASHGAG